MGGYTCFIGFIQGYFAAHGLPRVVGDHSIHQEVEGLWNFKVLQGLAIATAMARSYRLLAVAG